MALRPLLRISKQSSKGLGVEKGIGRGPSCSEPQVLRVMRGAD